MTRIDEGGRAARAYGRVQTRAALASVPAADGPTGLPEAEPAAAIAQVAAAALPEHLRDAFMALLAETEELRRTLAVARRRIEELERLVESDELMPVANRRGLIRDLARTLAEVGRHGVRAALIFVDVDRLKTINDVHGHLAGDAALVHIGETLRAKLRESDTVARLGGDEFAIVLRHVDGEQAQAKMEQIVAAVAAAPVRLRGESFTVTISAGLHVLSPGEAVEGALRFADSAMYAHKADKR
ncbi:GGDEF domain-containing protein [Sphingosinicella microcystinivorans]|uniref:GGDEF domain-containing protein n=1 Tax=Sphingosinicella microcystinivorans TaxID=335406 RepID=UPI0022F3D41B|nr:GGDEF domain-containing protein [Sphingosinicella microcystinivorans]WBX82567.1 GGDEF domain-containing protein [Sphingosinicella microcystinivorans]